MAFLDVSTALNTTAPLKASVFADMTAEAAGLQTLLHYDALPAKPMRTRLSAKSARNFPFSTSRRRSAATQTAASSPVWITSRGRWPRSFSTRPRSSH